MRAQRSAELRPEFLECRLSSLGQKYQHSLGMLQKRVFRLWREEGLEPIGLQESRHTAATWLDHAGVSPKVASQFMGHSTPAAQVGAARITLDEK